MRALVLALITFALPLSVFAQSGKEISGTVTIAKKIESTVAPTDVLFVFAKKAGGHPGDGQMPVAVLKVPSPKFPFNFSLTEKNVMFPGTPFDGPFSLFALLSKSGDPMDQTGPQGTIKTPVKIGQKDLKIELKPK